MFICVQLAYTRADRGHPLLTGTLITQNISYQTLRVWWYYSPTHRTCACARARVCYSTEPSRVPARGCFSAWLPQLTRFFLPFLAVLLRLDKPAASRMPHRPNDSRMCSPDSHEHRVRRHELLRHTAVRSTLLTTRVTRLAPRWPSAGGPRTRQPVYPAYTAMWSVLSWTVV